MPPQPPYWFPAKSSGWGWTFPKTWQGWLCMAPVFVGMITGFFAGGAGLTLVLIGLIATGWGSWTHGDPVGRRWRAPGSTPRE